MVMNQHLTSNKELRIKCPECRRSFIYIVPKVKKRHEYIIELDTAETVKCPLCLGEFEFSKRYLYGFIRN
jgi:hypothetical protein